MVGEAGADNRPGNERCPCDTDPHVTLDPEGRISCANTIRLMLLSACRTCATSHLLQGRVWESVLTETNASI